MEQQKSHPFKLLQIVFLLLTAESDTQIYKEIILLLYVFYCYVITSPYIP